MQRQLGNESHRPKVGTRFEIRYEKAQDIDSQRWEVEKRRGELQKNST